MLRVHFVISQGLRYFDEERQPQRKFLPLRLLSAQSKIHTL